MGDPKKLVKTVHGPDKRGRGDGMSEDSDESEPIPCFPDHQAFKSTASIFLQILSPPELPDGSSKTYLSTPRASRLFEAETPAHSHNSSSWQRRNRPWQLEPYYVV